jgi:hypothetical protein
MYSNYTTKTAFTQEKRYTRNTTFKNCTPAQLCNDFKKCPRCFDLWKKKQYAKAINHLTEKQIKEYKYKSFLTVVSLDTKISAKEKNSNLDLFLNDLIRGARYKASAFYQSEFFSMKQISYKNDFGANPHLHIIYLSMFKFIRNKKLKELLSKYNLRIDKKDIYKNEDRSYLTSIKKVVNYCLKANKDTFEIERNLSLTKGKRLIKKSVLFNNKKLQKKESLLYKYIHLKTAPIKAHYKQKLQDAKRIFKKTNRTNAKTYIKKLKTYRKKLKSINSAREYYLARARASAKREFYKQYTPA